MAKKQTRKSANTARSGSRDREPSPEQVLTDLSQDIGIVDLNRKVDRIGATVAGLAGLSSIDEVLGRGFETLSAQLLPLRELVPYREALSPDQATRLVALRMSLARPDWSSGGSLGVQEAHVFFIFEKAPPSLFVQTR